MKKIGIVTIFDRNGNYGNKLQNYATLRIYEELGYDCRTLVTQKPITKVEILKNYIFTIVKSVANKRWLCPKFSVKRLKNYSDFDRYLKLSYELIEDNILEDYSFFSVGSDQVWNPYYYKFEQKRKEMYLLTFAPNEKKIALAPSFGVEKFPDEWKTWFEKQLLTFKFISVREKVGRDIVYELTNREAEVLIDPTLMFDASEWRRISKVPKHIDLKKEYILTYFLGEKSQKTIDNIRNHARNNNLAIYNLLDSSDWNLFVTGPSEFISLIDNSKLVITDSFHACVFSFLFKKPFLVYSREDNQKNMFSRIDNLLTLFSLNRKKVGSSLKNDLFECDYSLGFRQLEKEREKVYIYLKKILSEEN